MFLFYFLWTWKRSLLFVDYLNYCYGLFCVRACSMHIYAFLNHCLFVIKKFFNVPETNRMNRQSNIFFYNKIS